MPAKKVLGVSVEGGTIRNSFLLFVKEHPEHQASKLGIFWAPKEDPTLLGTERLLETPSWAVILVHVYVTAQSLHDAPGLWQILTAQPKIPIQMAIPGFPAL